MPCPSCGGELNYNERFAKLTVCEYCQAAVVFDQRSLEVVGKMSMLAKASGLLFLGASGSFRDRTFSIIGRVRYAYEEGSWDEWYTSFSDGTTAWLTEDAGEFVLENPQKLPIDAEVLKKVALGTKINFTDSAYIVNEKGVAVCEGGEGQLPFRVLSGEEVPFFDLTSESGGSATIEIEPDGTVNAFIGEKLSRAELTLEEANPFLDEKQFNQVNVRGGRERLSYDSQYAGAIKCLCCGANNDSTDISGDSMKCTSCQADINLRVGKVECPGCGADSFSQNPEAKSLSCEYCGSLVDLTSGKPSLLGKIIQTERDKNRFSHLPLKVGMFGTLDGEKYQIVGLVRYVEKDGGNYYTQEYLLYSKSVGYRWLTLYNGHWTFEQNLKGIPTCFHSKDMIFQLPLHSSFTFQDHDWQFYERGIQHIDWIEGELPWVAKKGDMTRYSEAICPPYMLTAEEGERELEWSAAKYIEVAEVAQAFDLPMSKFQKPHTIWGPMVNKKESLFDGLKWSATLLCIAAFVICCLSFFKGEKVLAYKVNGSDYGDGHTSHEFVVDKAPSVCQVYFDTNCNNSWVYLKVGIVDSDENIIHDFTEQISYYHGSGWSEGSRNGSQVFAIDKPGNYKVYLAGEAGRGETGTDTKNGPGIKVTVSKDVHLSRFLVIAFIFILILTFIALSLAGRFERRRWEHLEED